MMISSGSTDLSGLFALLTAVSDPEAAKASLKEISDASQAYQDSVDKTRAELKQANDDLSAKKAEVDGLLAEAMTVKASNDSDYATRKKQLDDQDAVLSAKDIRCAAMEESLNQREIDVKAYEATVNSRDKDVTAREVSVQKLYDEATAMKDSYSIKMDSLRSIVGNSYVMHADPIVIGAAGNDLV